MIKVLIADDHAMVRQSIALLLQDVKDITVTGEAKSGEEALKLSRIEQPDVALIDVRMPGMGGLEAARQLLELNPEIRVIGLSGYNDGSYPGLFVSAGALGYITKNIGLDDMLNAIRTVYGGDAYLSTEIAQRVAESRDTATENPFSALSERELQVCLLLTESYQPEQVAERLGLSPRTIKKYRHRIFEKLNIESDVELVLLALRYGMIEAENTLQQYGGKK